MAVVIDTSIFIEVERQTHLRDVHLESVLGEQVLLASITASELLVGVHYAASSAQREKRERFVATTLDRYAVLPFALDEARAHAKLSAEMAKMGRKIGAHDLLIAATAISCGYSVLTHNLRDFERVPGLSVKTIDW